MATLKNWFKEKDIFYWMCSSVYHNFNDPEQFNYGEKEIIERVLVDWPYEVRVPRTVDQYTYTDDFHYSKWCAQYRYQHVRRSSVLYTTENGPMWRYFFKDPKHAMHFKLTFAS